MSDEELASSLRLQGVSKTVGWALPTIPGCIHRNHCPLDTVFLSTLERVLHRA